MVEDIESSPGQNLASVLLVIYFGSALKMGSKLYFFLCTLWRTILIVGYFSASFGKYGTNGFKIEFKGRFWERER